VKPDLGLLLLLFSCWRVKPILRTSTTWTVKQEEKEKEEEEEEEAMCRRPFPYPKASPGTQIPEMTG
jgi:hypothetical protein